MSLESLTRFVRRFCSDAALERLDRATDRELLRRFADDGEQDAFAVLTRRHAPLVMGVCRRWTGNEHDAEDAFQATFLVLARKAGRPFWQDSIASWLYRAALLVSRKTAATAQRRQQRDRQAGQARPLAAEPETDWSDLQRIMDEELSALAEKYRGPLLLCCLGEKSHEEAIRLLGISESTLRGRLWRGRELLRTRLARRGVEVGAVLVAIGLTQQRAVAALTQAVLTATVQSAQEITAGVAVTSVLSPQVLTLVKGATQAMWIAKVQTTATIVLTAGALALGAGLYGRQVAEAPPVPVVERPGEQGEAAVTAPKPIAGPVTPQKRYRGEEQLGISGRIKELDVEKRPATLTLRPRHQPVNLTFELGRDTQILIAGEPAGLTDLTRGADVVLMLAADNRSIASVHVPGKVIHGPRLQAVHPAERTIALDNGELVMTLPVRKDARIVIDGYLSRLEDLEPTEELHIELSRDRRSVSRILAPWARESDVRGRIRSVDPAGSGIAVGVGEQAERGQPTNFSVTPATRIYLNGQPAQLSDLKPDFRVAVRLTKDGKTAGVVRAELREAEEEDDDD